MATKTECITQSGAYHTLLCFIEGEVQIVVNLLILIVLLMVDSRLFADVSKMIITSFQQNARKLTINKINALKKRLLLSQATTLVIFDF